MVEDALSPTQRWVGYGLLAALCVGFAWAACPGLPATWGPRARSGPGGAEVATSEGPVAPDPVGRGSVVMPIVDGRTCVACHHQGGAGGGGGNRPAVVAVARPAPAERRGPARSPATPSTAFNRRVDAPADAWPTLVPAALRRVEPLEARRDEADDGVNTPALFGLGLIDRMSDAAILASALRGDQPAEAIPGRHRILPDGRVGRFGWKAEFATLEEFLAAGCGNTPRHGGGRRPAGRVHPAFHPERRHDLVKLVESLARPESLSPDSVADAEAAGRGEAQFAAVGCVACHTANLGGVSWVYGDFRLHRLGDRAVGAAGTPEPDAPPLWDEWRTPPLWGVADSAPYLHDGSAPTLEAAIARHRGDAEAVTRAYYRLGEGERNDLLAFLRTLRAPHPAQPLDTMAAVAPDQAPRPTFGPTPPARSHILRN